MNNYQLKSVGAVVMYDHYGNWKSTNVIESAFRELYSTSSNGNKRTPNPQTIVTRYRKNPSGTYYDYNWNGTWLNHTTVGLVAGQLPDIGSWPTSMETAAYNSALSTVVDKCRGSLDLSIDLAERRQTYSMVRSAAHAASDGIMSFLQKARSFQGALKFGGSSWLSYQYGWKPLVSSLYDTAEKVMDLDPYNHRVLIRGRGASKDSSRYDHWAGRVGIKCQLARSVRCEIGVLLSPRSQALAKLAGYTSLNPVSLAWELLPYSFVADWFLDVGGYLRAAETSLAYQGNFLTGYYTFSRQNELVQTGTLVYQSSNNRGINNSSGGISRTRRKDRVRLTAFPSPRFPTIDVNLGSQRLLSAASLLSQFLGRGR